MYFKLHLQIPWTFGKYRKRDTSAGSATRFLVRRSRNGLKNTRTWSHHHVRWLFRQMFRSADLLGPEHMRAVLHVVDQTRYITDHLVKCPWWFNRWSWRRLWWFNRLRIHAELRLRGRRRETRQSLSEVPRKVLQRRDARDVPALLLLPAGTPRGAPLQRNRRHMLPGRVSGWLGFRSTRGFSWFVF